MQFYSYINEESDLEEIKKILRKKCAPVLKHFSSNKSKIEALPLIGKKVNLKRPIKIRKTRKNRRPKDTPAEIHDFIDDYFENKYGSRFRSEAIFATGSYATAKTYGNVFIILPVGKYEVLWSPMVKDLYSEFLEKGAEMENCIWAVATGEDPEPMYDENELEQEWDERFGPGGDGEWKFDDYYSTDVDRWDATLDIIGQMGFDPDYDTDDKMRVEDIYSNLNSYVVNFQEQRTLLDEDIEVAELRYDGEVLATMYRAKNGKYYVEDEEGDIIPDKHGNEKFEYKEDAWQAYRRYLVKNAVKGDGIPISLDILNNFYDEDWADEKLAPFRNIANVYQTSDSPVEVVEDEVEWIPEIDLETYIEYRMEELGGIENCERIVYDVLDSYRTGDLMDAIWSNNEMMINCDYYILINIHLENDIMHWIKDEL